METPLNSDFGYPLAERNINFGDQVIVLDFPELDDVAVAEVSPHISYFNSLANVVKNVRLRLVRMNDEDVDDGDEVFLKSQLEHPLAFRDPLFVGVSDEIGVMQAKTQWVVTFDDRTHTAEEI